MNEYTIETGDIVATALGYSHREALSIALAIHGGERVGTLAIVTGPDNEPYYLPTAPALVASRKI